MNWEKECERWHQTAVKKLKQTRRCPFRLRVYKNEGRIMGVVDWVSRDGLSDEGRARLRAMNATFKTAPPTAVLLQSDSWQAGPKFFKHHGLEHLEHKERCDRYSEILSKEYKGTLANVPDALKSEAVFTIVKGPGFEQAHRLNFYRHEISLSGSVKDDKIVFIEDPYGIKDHGYFVSNLIPDWWEVTVQ